MGGAESKCEGLQFRDECIDNEVVQQLLKSAGTYAAEALLCYLLGYHVPAGLASKFWYIFNARDFMKAPGKKGEYILREVIEKNPKAYFKNLRGKGL